MSLESRLQMPFEIGTYHFELVLNNFGFAWKPFRIGTASLTFSQQKPTDLPAETREVYQTGDLYEVVFDGKIEMPVVKLIAEKGVFTSYFAIEGDKIIPLSVNARTKILIYNTDDTAVYDAAKNELVINDKRQKVKPEIMQSLRDPASHVVHLLFMPRKDEGQYLCGHYHGVNGEIHPLQLNYVKNGNKLIATAKISANTYFIDTDLELELPYTWSEDKRMFLPSLKEKVAVSHRLIGKIVFEYKGFSN